MRYDVIPSVHWKNTRTGQIASLYGACPFVTDTERADWRKETTGWTIRDNRSNTAGFGRKPFENRAEALQFAAERECTAAHDVLRASLRQSFPGKAFSLRLNTGEPTYVLVEWKHDACFEAVEAEARRALKAFGLEMAASRFITNAASRSFWLRPSGKDYRTC